MTNKRKANINFLLMNPYYDSTKKNQSYHFNSYQRKYIIPMLVQPIVSAIKKGYNRLAVIRFNKLFLDLGLTLDYEALMLKSYVNSALN